MDFVIFFPPEKLFLLFTISYTPLKQRFFIQFTFALCLLTMSNGYTDSYFVDNSWDPLKASMFLSQQRRVRPESQHDVTSNMQTGYAPQPPPPIAAPGPYRHADHVTGTMLSAAPMMPESGVGNGTGQPNGGTPALLRAIPDVYVRELRPDPGIWTTRSPDMRNTLVQAQPYPQKQSPPRRKFQPARDAPPPPRLAPIGPPAAMPSAPLPPPLSFAPMSGSSVASVVSVMPLVPPAPPPSFGGRDDALWRNEQYQMEIRQEIGAMMKGYRHNGTPTAHKMRESDLDAGQFLPHTPVAEPKVAAPMVVDRGDAVELWAGAQHISTHPVRFDGLVNKGTRPSFEKLSMEFHQEFVRYFPSVFDLKHIGQAFPRLKCIYGAESWKSCTVVGGERGPYSVAQGNRRVVPFNVFCNPHRYHWFAHNCVGEVDFQLPLSILEPMRPHQLAAISRAYPSLQVGRLLYNEDDHWQMDDLKVLMHALDEITSLDIVANMSLKNCNRSDANLLLNLPARENLKYLSLNLDRKCTWIELGPEMRSSILRLSDFFNLETLFFKPHSSFTQEQHQQTMETIAKLPKLKVFGTSLVAIFKEKRPRPISESIVMRGEKGAKFDFTFGSQTSRALAMIRNFTLIQQNLDTFMVDIASVGAIDPLDFSNDKVDVPKITNFTSSVNDSVASPIIDKLCFGDNLRFLKLKGCSIGFPNLPSSLTELSLMITPRTALEGYSRLLLESKFPSLKSVKLTTGGYYRDFDILSGDDNAIFMRSLGVVMQSMSQTNGLLLLRDEWVQKKVFSAEYMVLKMFDMLQSTAYTTHFQAICDILIEPKNNFANYAKTFVNLRCTEDEAAAIRFLSFIELFVTFLVETKTLEYLHVDGYAYLNTSPRFHSYIVRQEYPDKKTSLKEIKFTGTCVYKTEVGGDYDDNAAALVVDSGRGRVDQLPILFQGFPIEYLTVAKALKDRTSLFIFDLESRRREFVSRAAIWRDMPQVFALEASEGMLTERGDIGITQKPLNWQQKMKRECFDSVIDREGWIRS